MMVSVAFTTLTPIEALSFVLFRLGLVFFRQNKVNFAAFSLSLERLAQLTTPSVLPGMGPFEYGAPSFIDFQTLRVILEKTIYHDCKNFNPNDSVRRESHNLSLIFKTQSCPIRQTANIRWSTGENLHRQYWAYAEELKSMLWDPMVGLPEWSQVNEQPTGSVSQGNWER
jgi:hypothetical protein